MLINFVADKMIGQLESAQWLENFGHGLVLFGMRELYIAFV